MNEHTYTTLMIHQDLPGKIAEARMQRNKVVLDAMRGAYVSVCEWVRKTRKASAPSNAQQEQMIRTMPVF